MKGSLTGAGTLIRFILRRDRVRLPVWIIGIVAFVVASAASFPDIYTTEAERQARAEIMENPVTAALSGPGYGLDNYTYGAMLANELLSWAALAVALMSIFMVVRHTRSEEESGRTELARSLVVGPHAGAAATLVVVSVAHLVMAGLFALLLPLLHEDFTVVGSIAFGLSLAAVGVVFAGVGIVVAQLSQHARTATGYGIAALGVAYSLRALGDAAFGPLSWLSPIGWSQATRPYVDERWWPLLISAGFAALLAGVGLYLSTRRDVGGGLIETRPGPREASDVLVHPLGLALRLQRGMLVAWGAGLLLFGLAYGTLLDEVEQFAGELPQLEEWIVAAGGTTFAESFVSVFALFLALLAAAAGVQGALRLRGEESAGRAEPVLATGLARWRWTASYLAVALGGSALILVLSGAAMGLTASASTGDAAWLATIPAAVLVHVPATWSVVGLATALFGLVPRLTGLAWAVVGYAAVVGAFEGFLNFPQWMMNLSPFTHTPQVPAADFAVFPVAVLATVAAALIAAGMVGFHRRDIATT